MMSIHRLHLVLCMVSLLPWFSISNQPARAAQFFALGDLPGGAFYSIPFAIPVDSKAMVVVGTSSSALGSQAFYWTPTSGMVGLGDLPDGEFYSGAFGVSGDGSVVVGAGSSSSGGEAFRWEGGEMTGLGDLPEGEFESGAWDVSADGAVIVGSGASAASSANREAFRQVGGVMTSLGDLTGGLFHSRATGVNHDGSVIVGSSTYATHEEAFRWEGGEMTGLGDLSGGRFTSNAWATSADGAVIVGGGISTSGREAFRWEGGEMTGLGDLPGGDFSSIAYSVSGDGSVIVGTGSSASSDRAYNEAFIWNPVNGMLGLQNVLEDHLGLDLAGWTLTSARDISFDSRVITGEGINPQGNREAWLVQSFGSPFGPIVDPSPFIPNPYPFPDFGPIPDPFPFPEFPFIELPDPCAFGGDASCNTADLDALYAVFNTSVPSTDSLFDLNFDNVVDAADLSEWLSLAATENGHSSAYLRGDTDLDRNVDLADYSALATNFDPTGSLGPHPWDHGNFDGDNNIDLSDYNALASNFQPLGYGTAAVPEPCTALLALLGMLLFSVFGRLSVLN